MTKTEKEILAYVRKNPGKKAKAIASDLGMDKSEVNKILYKLKDLEHVWRSAEYVWAPVQKQEPERVARPKQQAKKTDSR
jgi:predicted transcriptional regulator